MGARGNRHSRFCLLVFSIWSPVLATGLFSCAVASGRTCVPARRLKGLVNMTRFRSDRLAVLPPETHGGPPTSCESERRRLIDDLAILVVRQCRRSQQGTVDAQVTPAVASSKAK